jgi:hypothetical protein
MPRKRQHPLDVDSSGAGCIKFILLAGWSFDSRVGQALVELCLFLVKHLYLLFCASA